MNRRPVKSSNVVSAGYDTKERILEVEFTSGVYQYYNVDEKVYKNLLSAPSAGKFIYSDVRGRYRFKKI